MTIVGAGARTTILRGNSQNRVIDVTAPADATISHLTLSDGNATPSGNYFGGNLANYGATVVLDHVRVTQGHAYSAGGIANRGGTMTIQSSLIDHNFADSGGSDVGGIMNFGGDGPAASLTIRDSTVAFNRARLAGGISSSGNAANTTRLERVTLAYNYGGDRLDVPNAGGLSFESGQSVVVAGSIIAGNSTAAGPSNCIAQPITSQGYNLQDGTDCQLAGTDDLQATDPQFVGAEAALEDAGGETDVLTFGAASPARDIGGTCSLTDQTDAARPQGLGCDAGAWEFRVAATQPPPTPTPTPTVTPVSTPVATPTATPVAGQSVGAKEVGGKVLVKVPGSNRFVALDPSVIKNGAEVDTRTGTVEITRSDGGVARFHDGIFKLSQSGGITTLTLTEKLTGCPKAKSSASAAAKKPKTRKLWGDGKGKFRTRGQYSAATIRGTKWLVQDTCTSTITKVQEGVVSVRDEVKKKTIALRKGKSYTARPARR